MLNTSSFADDITFLYQWARVDATLCFHEACQVAAPIGSQTTALGRVYQNASPGAKYAIDCLVYNMVRCLYVL